MVCVVGWLVLIVDAEYLSIHRLSVCYGCVYYYCMLNFILQTCLSQTEAKQTDEPEIRFGNRAAFEPLPL